MVEVVPAIRAGGIVAAIASVFGHILQTRRDKENLRKEASVRALDDAVEAIRVFCGTSYFDAISPLGKLSRDGLIATQRLLYTDLSPITDNDAIAEVIGYADAYLWTSEQTDSGGLVFAREVARRLLWTGGRGDEMKEAGERLIDAQRRIVESARSERARLLG